jgi:hypothetical protein
MKTISSHLIGAYVAHQWGSRKDRGNARDAVPASRVDPSRFLARRALRVLARLSQLSRRAEAGRQQYSRSFSSPGWITLFAQDNVMPIRLQPCRAASIAPGPCRRRPD